MVVYGVVWYGMVWLYDCDHYRILSWSDSPLSSLFQQVDSLKCSVSLQALIVYNFICCVVSLYSLFYIIKALSSDWPQSLFSLAENPDVKHAFLVYWLTKIVELMDTVFMVLRHRQRQISFLHVSWVTSLARI